MAKQSGSRPRAGKQRIATGEGREKVTEHSGITKRQRPGKLTTKDRGLRDAPAGLDGEHEAKMQEAISKYGDPPLKGLVDDQWPASKVPVVMAHILNVLLSSTRISHSVAIHTLGCLLDEGYHDIDVLRHTSWAARVKLLDSGGYVRYDEKTATYLGELRKLLTHKYDDDASKVLPAGLQGEEARSTLSTRLQEVKGIGPVGTTIFLGSIQHSFPSVAPFLDPRSLKTAAQIGLGSDVDAIFAALGHSTCEMAKLEVALTKIRLEKREKEFK